MAVGAVLTLGLTPAAGAATPAGAVGHDVSYPQCTASGASTTTVGGLGGAFGVVGVTGGRPFGANSCAGSEFSWASGLPQAPELYMNTANPAPTSSYYWPTSGSSDPALCQTASSTTDPGCAYDYGWHAAADALSKEAVGLANASSLTWWLDVETGNSWNGNGTSNAADLQGATDYLRSQGVPAVGIYSTSSQWSTITGGYSAATVSNYTSAWAPEFSPKYPMTASPVWVAGLGSSSTASSNCTTSFSGGPAWLAQYSDGSGYDADLSCQTAGSMALSAIGPLSAGAPSQAIQVQLSAAAPGGGLNVSVTSSSSAATFSGAATGPFSSGPLQVTVPAGATTSPAFYYEDTRAGTAVLTAAAAGWTSGNETVSVAAGALQSLRVTASSSSMSIGASDSLTAQGTDAYGNTVAATPTWSSTDGGSFSPASGPSTTYSGPSQTGNATITASQGAVTGSTTINVVSAPSLLLSITSGSSSYTKSTYRIPVTTTTRTSAGGTVQGAAVSWHALPGACPGSGTTVTSGSGTTSSAGTYGFRLSVRSAGSYCMIATVTASGYTSGNATATVVAG